jgi:phosphoribosylanthranilate isomerase
VLSPKLKICGLRDCEQAVAIARLGVDAIGVIGVAGTPRWLEPAARQVLFEAVAMVRPAVEGVLVVADPSEGEMEELLPERGHRVVQLHGQESPETCTDLRRRLGCAVWKALRVRSQGDLDRARSYVGAVDALVLDAWAPDQLGGTGRALPIDWLRGFGAPMPWWLAGGVSAQRFPALLAELSPAGLDVSSSVEHSPGDKDLAKVADLVEALRLGSQRGSGEDRF